MDKGDKAAILAVGSYAPNRMEAPWIDYRKRFSIGPAGYTALRDAYREKRKLTGIPDRDLARLNFRRCLTQGNISVIEETLADRRGTLFRDYDLPLICGYIGETTLEPLYRAYEAADHDRGDRSRTIIQAIAFVSAWNAHASDSVHDFFDATLMNYTQQNRILNGQLLQGAIQALGPDREISIGKLDALGQETSYFELAEPHPFRLAKAELFSA